MSSRIEEKVKLNPKQITVAKLIISNSSFYLNFALYQPEFAEWVNNRLNRPNFKTAIDELKAAFPNQNSDNYREFVFLLKEIVQNPPKEITETIAHFVQNYPAVVEFLFKHRTNSAINCYLDVAQDIQYILSSHATFFINFAFFYDGFAQWIQTKNKLVDEYDQMTQEFWSSIPKDRYDEFVDALILFRENKNELPKSIKRLAEAHPSVAAFLFKYENSPVIIEFNNELQNDKNDLNALIDKAINVYHQRKNGPLTDSPPTPLKNEVLTQDSPKPLDPNQGRTVLILFCGTCSRKSDYQNIMYDKVGETISSLGHMLNINDPEEEYQSYIIVDGPGTNNERNHEYLGTKPYYSVLRGILFGAGTEENKEHALYWLRASSKKNRPDPNAHWILDRMNKAKTRGPITRVVIAGWSRGGVEAIETHYEMYHDKALQSIEVNLVLIDPVPGKFNFSKYNRHLYPNVNRCVILLSQDEGSPCFEPVIPERVPGNTKTIVECYSAPGSHATMVGNPFYRDADKITGKPLPVVKPHEIPMKHHHEYYYNLKAVGILNRDCVEKTIEKCGFRLPHQTFKNGQGDEIVERDFEHFGILINRNKPGVLALTHQQQRALATHIKYNLSGYRKLRLETYTWSNREDIRRVTYGNQYTVSFHLLDQIDHRGRIDNAFANDDFNMLKGTFLAERLDHRHHRENSTFLQQLKETIIQVSKADPLKLGSFISVLLSDHIQEQHLNKSLKRIKHHSLHNDQDVSKKFYYQYCFSAYEYLEISTPVEHLSGYLSCILLYTSILENYFNLNSGELTEEQSNTYSNIYTAKNTILLNLVPNIPLSLTGIEPSTIKLYNSDELLKAFIRLHFELNTEDPIQSIYKIWNSLVRFKSGSTNFWHAQFEILLLKLFQSISAISFSRATCSLLPKASPYANEKAIILISAEPQQSKKILPNHHLKMEGKDMLVPQRAEPILENLPPVVQPPQNIIQKRFDFNSYWHRVINSSSFKYLKQPSGDQNPSNIHKLTNNRLKRLNEKWFSDEIKYEAMLDILKKAECAIYYKKLDQTVLSQHTMVSVLNKLSEFVDQQIQQNTNSTTIHKISKLLKKHWDNKDNKNVADSARIFLDCRAIINKRLNSVGNFFATRSFLFFSKRSQTMEQFYQDVTKVSLLADEVNAESIEQFEKDLSARIQP